eukprot:3411797-Amphidinium_carterae.1
MASSGMLLQLWSWFANFSAYDYRAPEETSVCSAWSPQGENGSWVQSAPFDYHYYYSYSYYYDIYGMYYMGEYYIYESQYVERCHAPQENQDAWTTQSLLGLQATIVAMAGALGKRAVRAGICRLGHAALGGG